MTVMADECVLPRLVRLQAVRSPNVVAVECGNGRITYGQLWSRSATVAAQIRRLDGYRYGDLLAVRFPRGIAGVVAMLGVWRAGGAYLPLDTSLPPGRLAAVVADAKPRAVLVPSATGLSALDTPVLEVLEDGPFDASEDGEDGEADAQGIAYVIYTSGSTGAPKGVEVGHPGLAELVTWHGRTYGTGPGVRVAALAGPGFDASVWETWATLGNGATLVLPSDIPTADIDAVADFLDEQAIEQCFLSTPLAEQLLGLGRCPSSLRILTTGGDRLRVHPPAGFPAAVFNHYGPTEATVVTTASGDLRGHDGTGFPVIGRPIESARVRLVDESGTEITEAGTEGELLIAGRILAVGYRHDAQLTADRFFLDADGVRWYRSGDVCRWNDRNELEFVCRRDRQVQISGYRIEPAEIERVMLSLPGVDQAAVVVREEQGEQELLGFYCGSCSTTDIRDGLGGQVPGYMVPTEIQKLDRMPLNITGGKVDRRALLTGYRPAEQDEVVPDGQQSTEQRIAAIWSGLLGREISGSDNFFTAGGHSLIAAKITALVRKEFGVGIGLGAMFNCPVLTDYAAKVDALLKGKA